MSDNKCLSDKNIIKEEDKENSYKELRNTIRYHFTEFNVWVAFFVTINGGLLAAYISNDSKPIWALLIPIFGLVVSFLFRYLGEAYHFCIRDLSIELDKYKYGRSYISRLRDTKKSTTNIVRLFSWILTYLWEMLCISEIFRDNKMNSLKSVLFFKKDQCSLSVCKIIILIILTIFITIINVVILECKKEIKEKNASNFGAEPKNIPTASSYE